MLYPLRNNSFIMTEEEINIDIYPVYVGLYGRDFTFFIQYNCRYIFKNETDAQTYLLGFPVSYGIIENPVGDNTVIDPFYSDFRVYQNDKMINYRKYIHGFNPELKNIFYDEVYGFFVPMGKKDKTEIRVQYSIIISDLMQNYGKGINYILKSGSNFPKPIGKADINIRFHYAIDTESSSSYRRDTTYPDKLEIISSGTLPFCTYTWHFVNFIPSEDIFAMILMPDMKFYSDISKETEFINNAKNDKSLGPFFQLQNFLSLNNKILSVKAKNGISAIFRKRAGSLLADNTVSPVLKGFIINRILDDENLSPGKIIMQNAIDSSGKIISELIMIETENLDAVLEYYRKNPLDIKNIKLLTRYLGTEKHYLIFNYVFKNNYYIQEIKKVFQYSMYADIYAETEKLLKASFYNKLEQLLENKTTDFDEILDLMNYESVNVMNEYIKQNIERLTGELWNTKSEKDKQAVTLSKLLPAAIIRSVDEREPDILEEILYKRTILRKAYYALANYYYHSDYQKSIYYYRISFSFCNTSPLWDFLGYREGMMGKFLSWSDDPVKNLHLWENDFTPWWKYLSHDTYISEREIADIFSPGRLLNQNLESWEQEDYNAAPCYFIAYNAACIQSIAGQSNDALQWLEIAYRLNKKKIREIAWTDSDLEMLRSKETKWFTEILSE